MSSLFGFPLAGGSAYTDAQAKVAAMGLVHPGYVANRWYWPSGSAPNLVALALGAAGTLRLYPFILPQAITISDLLTRVTVGVGGVNLSLAIYNSDPVTKLPTTVAASTGSISAAAAATVSATLGSPVSLPAGLYWMASNVDTTGLTVATYPAATTQLGAEVGATSAANLYSTNTLYSRSFTQAYGTWPDLTAQATIEGPSIVGCFIGFKVASVP